MTYKKWHTKNNIKKWHKNMTWKKNDILKKWHKKTYKKQNTNYYFNIRNRIQEMKDSIKQYNNFDIGKYDI